MKLQLFISHNGGVSRRKSFDHILAGEVTVNGMVIREPSHMIEPGEDVVTLLGREIKLKDYEYIMLNKPSGYVTTCEAQFDQWAVMSLLPANLRHLKPVGRLDKDTQGLLLLTNDGELANRLAHPSFDVNKTYHVRVVRRLEYREKARLEEGVVIDKFRTAPAEVANITFDGDFSEFDLTIHEGHKHQVRLMCHEVGHDVVKLTRIAQGPLKLDLQKPGAWRPLTAEELAKLHEIGRTNVAPVFKSHSPERRYSANRDWHSGQPPKPKDVRPRDEQGEKIGVEQGQERPREERPRGERFDRVRPEGTSRVDRPQGERKEYKPYNRDERPRGDRPGSDRPRSDRPWSGPRRDERSRSDRPQGERKEYKPYNRDERPRGDRPGSDRPRSDRPWSGPRRDERPRSDRPQGERKEYKPYNRDERPRGDRPRSDRPVGSPATGPRTFGAQNPFGKKSFGKKPYSSNKPFGKKPFSRPKY